VPGVRSVVTGRYERASDSTAKVRVRPIEGLVRRRARAIGISLRRQFARQRGILVADIEFSVCLIIEHVAVAKARVEVLMEAQAQGYEVSDEQLSRHNNSMARGLARLGLKAVTAKPKLPAGRPLSALYKQYGMGAQRS